MELGQVCLRRGEEQALRQGRRRIYDNEIDWYDDSCRDGDLVQVLDSRQRFLAAGFFNAQSKIAVRVLTYDPNEQIDRAFFRCRIAQAWERRQRLGFSDACRVVFGESDALPGLTVDKYGGYLSFQITSLGLERFKPELISILVELFSPAGIFERDDLTARRYEGLAQTSGCVYGEVPDQILIREHDAKMLVSLRDGQKTGHFLDQQENRGRLRPYAKDQDVLDLCCCSGGFSIHAALYGAKSVEAVDISEQALALTRANAVCNGVADKITTTCANVFDLARAYAAEGRQYGLIICDPPAFAKSKRALDGAQRGYRELNLRCMKLLRPGGILLTCSCSQFMTQPLFYRVLTQAAQDSGRTVRVLESVIQSRDHPAALNVEQSLYLKGYILQAD